MKFNSTEALEAGRRLYQEYGNDWSQVRRAGRELPDGVIDLTQPKSSDQAKSANGRARRA
jgi:hypothetical protein